MNCTFARCQQGAQTWTCAGPSRLSDNSILPPAPPQDPPTAPQHPLTPSFHPPLGRQRPPLHPSAAPHDDSSPSVSDGSSPVDDSAQHSSSHAARSQEQLQEATSSSSSSSRRRGREGRGSCLSQRGADAAADGPARRRDCDGAAQVKPLQLNSFLCGKIAVLRVHQSCAASQELALEA